MITLIYRHYPLHVPTYEIYLPAWSNAGGCSGRIPALPNGIVFGFRSDNSEDKMEQELIQQIKTKVQNEFKDQLKTNLSSYAEGKWYLPDAALPRLLDVVRSGEPDMGKFSIMVQERKKVSNVLNNQDEPKHAPLLKKICLRKI